MAANKNVYLQNLMEAIMPNMRKQQEATYNYLVQLGQRQGIPQAMRSAMKAVAPYAAESGEAAAKAGAEAERLSQRESEYARQLEQREKELAAQREMWEKQFGASQEQQEFSNMMALSGMTGLTPEMLSRMGYNPGDLGLPMSGASNRMAGIMSKFGGKNPVVNKLYGSGSGGGYNYGGNMYNTYGYRAPTGSGGGGASYRYSTPANPFRRVTGPGQGPGLMAIS